MCRFRRLALVWEENCLVRVVAIFGGVDEESTPGRKRRVSDSDILEIFQATNDPVLTVGDVAEQLPIGKRGLHDRLRNLEDEGLLASKLAGQTTVWWSPKYTTVTSDDSDDR